jgi:hypothetical protein
MRCCHHEMVLPFLPEDIGPTLDALTHTVSPGLLPRVESSLQAMGGSGAFTWCFPTLLAIWNSFGKVRNGISKGQCICPFLRGRRQGVPCRCQDVPRPSPRDAISPSRYFHTIAKMFRASLRSIKPVTFEPTSRPQILITVAWNCPSPPSPQPHTSFPRILADPIHGPS